MRIQKVEIHPVRHTGDGPYSLLIPRPDGPLKRSHPAVRDGEDPDVDVIGPAGKVVTDPDRTVQDRAGAGVVAGDQFPAVGRRRPKG